MSRQTYRVPGQYTYDDITLCFGESKRATIDRIKAGDVPKCDVIVATYPRAGTSRLVHILWELLQVNKPSGHDQSVQEDDIRSHYVFMDECEAALETFPKQNGPVIAKTHLPFPIMRALVEQRRKVIVGVRNVKDCLVSYFHFHKIAKPLGCYQGSWEDFFEFVKAGDVVYGDIFDWYCGWWQQRTRDNLLFVSFEDLSRAPCHIIKKMAEFLDIPNVTQEVTESIASASQFESMKANSKTNFSSGLGVRYVGSYMRKGVVGDWKNYFTEDQNTYINDLYEQRILPIGLKMEFEL